MAAALANPIVSVRNPQKQLFSGSSPMLADQCLGSTNLSIAPRGATNLRKLRKSLKVQAKQDNNLAGGAGLFISGFALGGAVVGVLGAIYAPQLSRALAGVHRKDLLRKLPKFIYDEDKFYEKARKQMIHKIAALDPEMAESLRQKYGWSETEIAEQKVDASS